MREKRVQVMRNIPNYVFIIQCIENIGANTPQNFNWTSNAVAARNV